MDFSEKLKLIRTKKGYGVNQLASKAGISPSSISRFESGERKQPTLETIEKLSEALNVPTSYFFDNDLSDSKSISVKLAKYSIPIYGRIVASKPEGAEEEIQGHIDVQSEVVDKYGIDNLIALKVNGDSINRIIPDGAIAILLRTNEVDDISSGDICAVSINGNEATIKHIYKTPNRILFEPDSYNPEHEPFEFHNECEARVTIIGKYLYAVVGR